MITGDLTAVRMPRTVTLVHLVANTIMNPTAHDDQLAVFANAAARLEPGRRLVAEVIVPPLRRVPGPDRPDRYPGSRSARSRYSRSCRRLLLTVRDRSANRTRR